MSDITEDIARRLRVRGYDAAPERWDAIDNDAPPTELVAVNAVLVIGWRYPDGDWKWDDRPSYLVDNGAGPLTQAANPPYNNSSHRWQWLPSRLSKPEEHPRDDATATQLATWVQRRLPLPWRPDVLLFWHPNDLTHTPELAAELNLPLSRRTWPWTADWEKAWADHDGRPDT